MTTAIETDLPDVQALRREQAKLRDLLARLRRRLAWQATLETLADAAVLLVAAGALLVLMDWWFRLSTSARLVLGPLVVAGVTLSVGRRAVRRWRSAQIDELSLAVTLDRFRPGIGQQVADVLQLPDLLDDPTGSSSPQLVRLAVRRASAALAASDWHLLWNRGRTLARLAALLAAIAVPVAFALLAPEAARLSAARWLVGSDERWPQKTYLSVVGLGDAGRLIAPRDEPFVMEVRSDLPDLEERNGRWFVGGRGEALALRSRPESSVAPDDINVSERVPGKGRRDGIMGVTTPAHFRFEFPPNSQSSTFQIEGGDDWLGPLILERLDRPTLAETRLRVREPGATYQGLRTIEDARQHLVFLPDTQIELTLVGNEPLADLTLTVHPGATPELKRVDAKSFAASWTLAEATTLEIKMTSESTGLTSKPVFLSVGLMRDREPRVTLRAVGVGARVTPIATIPLNLAATDDLGLAVFRLQVERIAPAADGADPAPAGADVPTPPKRQTVPIPLPGAETRLPLDHQARHDVELQTDSPPVGTILKFVAEAEDRCARGAQTGRSGTLQLQVISADELFYELLIRQRAERTKFIAALDNAEKQGPALADKPNRDALLTAMRVMHASSRQLDQIGGRIADTLQEMKLNQIGSPKSHRLLQEGVIDPIRALNAGSMNELRAVLQSLTGGAPRPGADAAAAKKLHDEVIVKMRNILDQMSQWESFVDVVNQIAEVIKMQQGVVKATEDARESRTQEIFNENP